MWQLSFVGAKLAVPQAALEPQTSSSSDPSVVDKPASSQAHQSQTPIQKVHVSTATSIASVKQALGTIGVTQSTIEKLGQKYQQRKLKAVGIHLQSQLEQPQKKCWNS